MNRSFQNVALFFFLGLGAVYLTADFLLHQLGRQSETLQTIYTTFDMPFFFSAGAYFLSRIYQAIQERFQIQGLQVLFWVFGMLWTAFLLSINLGFKSFL